MATEYGERETRLDAKKSLAVFADAEIKNVRHFRETDDYAVFWDGAGRNAGTRTLDRQRLIVCGDLPYSGGQFAYGVGKRDRFGGADFA